MTMRWGDAVLLQMLRKTREAPSHLRRRARGMRVLGAEDGTRRLNVWTPTQVSCTLRDSGGLTWGKPIPETWQE